MLSFVTRGHSMNMEKLTVTEKKAAGQSGFTLLSDWLCQFSTALRVSLKASFLCQHPYSDLALHKTIYCYLSSPLKHVLPYIFSDSSSPVHCIKRSLIVLLTSSSVLYTFLPDLLIFERFSVTVLAWTNPSSPQQSETATTSLRTLHSCQSVSHS